MTACWHLWVDRMGVSSGHPDHCFLCGLRYSDYMPRRNRLRLWTRP